MTEKRRHILKATEEQLADLLRGKPAELRELYLKVHGLVLECLPGVVHETDCKDGTTGYGIRQYGYNGWGLGALSAHSKWVSLNFFRGTDLEDPKGLLEGGGKKLRHVKLRSQEAFDRHRDDLGAFIVAASRLHESAPAADAQRHA